MNIRRDRDCREEREPLPRTPPGQGVRAAGSGEGTQGYDRALPIMTFSAERTPAGSILIQNDTQLFEGGSCKGFSSMVMARCLQASTHSPHPMHFSG